MNFLKKKPNEPDAAGTQLAGKIAACIIRWQSLIARKLNTRFNQYSKRRQKWLLGIFCGLTVIGISLCLLIPFGRMAISNKTPNYQPLHIGLPSDPVIKPGHYEPTDSLTTKK